MFKSAVRRSACDQCRAKRVRCLRAENSLAPCARCSHIGARCVTGAARHPGRPPKSRRVDCDSTPSAPTASADDVSSPNPERHRTSTSREINHVEVQTPETTHLHPPGDLLAHGPQPDFWETPGDSSAFFNSPSVEHSPVPNNDILALVNQLSGPQLQGLLSTDNGLNAMLHMGCDSVTGLIMEIDPLLDPWDGVLPPSPEPKGLNPASSLMRFREEMDRHIAAAEAYYSDPLKAMQGCKEDGASRETDNPAALLLTCSKEFIDIIQSLTPHPQNEDSLSTEIVLLALSSYLSLMRLFDSIFYTIYTFICELPPDSFKSIKVQSVLQIGGISALQDLPLKTYATGILDVIQDQVRTLERCMGIPTEYCLSGESTALPTPGSLGMFSRADRARLFWAVMELEDTKPRRSSKSYVESIRASIRDSMKFLD